MVTTKTQLVFHDRYRRSSTTTLLPSRH